MDNASVDDVVGKPKISRATEWEEIQCLPTVGGDSCRCRERLASVIVASKWQVIVFCYDIRSFS